MPEQKPETFFIGELAARSGVSRDTIRYYETTGVLPPAARSGGGYRLYDADDVERISFIGQAQTLGLTLEEITQILAIVDDGGEPCVHVRQRLSARLEETRDGIRRLRALEHRLAAALRCVDDQIPVSGCRCAIIESAGGRPVQTDSSMNRFPGPRTGI